VLILFYYRVEKLVNLPAKEGRAGLKPLLLGTLALLCVSSFCGLEILHLQAQDVILLHLAFLQHCDEDKSPKHLFAFMGQQLLGTTSWILARVNLALHSSRLFWSPCYYSPKASVLG
jgi:hypothetical protein